MVDYEMFRRLYPDKDIFDGRIDELGGEAMQKSEPPDDDFLAMLPPRIYAFDIESKAWSKFASRRYPSNLGPRYKRTSAHVAYAVFGQSRTHQGRMDNRRNMEQGCLQPIGDRHGNARDDSGRGHISRAACRSHGRSHRRQGSRSLDTSAWGTRHRQDPHCGEYRGSTGEAFVQSNLW